MRLVAAAPHTGALSMPSSLSWPEPSSSLLALSGLLHGSEPLTADPHHSLPYLKGCKAYEDGWSKLDDAPLNLLPPQAPPASLMAARDQRGGIEKLVDELCAKLKQIQDGETEAPQTPRPNFALVLQDMHDAHYSGYPSLGAECGNATFAAVGEAWSNECNNCWLTIDNNRTASQHLQNDDEQLNKDDEFLRVLAENHHNALTSSLDDNDSDLLLDETPSNDDPSLAKLIAKFNSNVEALWSPESMIMEDRSPQVESQSFISSGTNLTSSIWSDTSTNDQSFTSQVVGSSKTTTWSDPKDDALNLKNIWNSENDNSSWKIGYGLGLLSQQILEGENELQQNSLNLINHHRERSGFTEVPKTITAKTSWSTDQQPVENLTVALTLEQATDTGQDDEDLLTSEKTHFQPIESIESEQNVASSQDTVRYEDGTTFAISSSLDKPPFTRSSSGFLYLNATPESPKKYMLYTEKEPFNGKYNTGGFIPKFAVRKSEKSVQTDKDGEDSDIEEDKGFYFPEDEGQFADNIDCPADIEDEGESEDEDSEPDDDDDDDFGSKWKTKHTSWVDEQGHSNIPTWRDAKWVEGEAGVVVSSGGETGSSWCRRLWREDTGGGDCKPSSALLRAELSAEGEQLFADIQYLQTLFLGDCWASHGQEDDEETSEDNVKGASPIAEVASTSPLSRGWHQSERTYDELTEAPTSYLSRTVIPQSVWENTSTTQPGL